MEKIYGPFNLEEHKYFIRINRAISSPVIKVFELFEGASKIYTCHYNTTPEEISRLIGIFDELGGEEFIKDFLIDENTTMKKYDRHEYFKELMPILKEKWSSHLLKIGVKEVHLEFKKSYEIGNKRFLSEHGDFFVPLVKKFISPEHPLIIFEYIEEQLEHIEDQQPYLKNDGTIVIPCPFGYAYARLKDHGSVEVLQKKWREEEKIWNRTLEEAEDIISFDDTDLDSFKEYANSGGLDEYGMYDEPTPLPDTQHEVVFETKDKREYVTIDRASFAPSIYYVDEDGTLDLSYAAIDDISEINGLDKLTNLQVLDLSGNPITSTSGLGRLTNLRELYIKNTKFYDEMGWFGSGYDSFWIRTISGLNHLTNLQKLEITWARVKKISGLNQLTNLRHLDLSTNHIYKIEGLDKLTNLEYLDLSGNRILVIEGLENLKNLKTLKLSIDEENMRSSEIHLVELAEKNPQAVVKYCQDKKEGKLPFVMVRGEKCYVIDNELILGYMGITNLLEIDGLEQLTNLQTLDLSGNMFTDIQGLEQFANLQTLNLNSNSIKEIKGLEQFTNLQTLNLGHNPIVETKGLENLTSLKELYLYLIHIEEIRGLEQLTNLQKLILRSSKITRIQGLETLTNLQELDLSTNQIKEIKGLEKLTNLKTLTLRHNKIKEIKGLEHLTSLQKIDLAQNPIRDDEKHLVKIGFKNAQEIVKYCQEKKKLKNPFVTVKRSHLYKSEDKDDETQYSVIDNILDLSGIGLTDISDIKDLENFTKLKELNLHWNQIQEIRGLEKLTNLKILKLSHNQIQEIKGLENLTSLHELQLWDNQIQEIKGLENLTNLKILFLHENPIREEERHLLDKNAQEIVKFCQEKAKKAKEGG